MVRSFVLAALSFGTTALLILGTATQGQAGII